MGTSNPASRDQAELSPARLRRLKLFNRPTPLERLDRLSKHLAGPAIFMKRDDCGTLGGGGNKLRKLEFLLGLAVSSRADTVVTSGAIQSNHVRQTAAACARVGLYCEAVLTDSVADVPEQYRSSGNVLLSSLAGARLHIVSGSADGEQEAEKLAKRLANEGRRPFVIPVGGSNAVGALGYFFAAKELLAQIAREGAHPAAIVHASGSGGTQAGLIEGLREAKTDCKVIGVSVGASRSRQIEKVGRVLRELQELLGHPARPKPAIHVDDRFVGDGYGQPTAEMIEAVRLTAETEGIYLDPVYSGKAMAGLIRMIAEGVWERDQSVVFVHTGGTPGLFAYEQIFRR